MILLSLKIDFGLSIYLNCIFEVFWFSLLSISKQRMFTIHHITTISFFIVGKMPVFQKSYINILVIFKTSDQRLTDNKLTDISISVSSADK